MRQRFAILEDRCNELIEALEDYLSEID